MELRIREVDDRGGLEGNNFSSPCTALHGSSFTMRVIKKPPTAVGWAWGHKT